MRKLSKKIYYNIRRIILKIINNIIFNTCLDAGCAQPYLIKLLTEKGKIVFGCDISEDVIVSNRSKFNNAQFEVLDLSKEVYPGDKHFDLVICSEVIEHILDWRSAVKNLTAMAEKYLLITVPIGKIHNSDKKFGHIRHFEGDDLRNELEKNNFSIELEKKWGYPFHTLYKYAIDLFNTDTIYENYACSKYNISKKLLAEITYLLFFINDIFRSGSMFFILAKKK